MITNKDLILADKEIQRKRKEKAKEHSLAFVRYTMPTFQSTQFHNTYYKVLNYFVLGKIKKLIVSCPPQHGKSKGSSENVPAQMIGRNKDLNIATVCYSSTVARKFGRKVKQLLCDPLYRDVFDARVPDRSDVNFISTAEKIEIANGKGSLKMVGYEGGLTSDPVDVLIMDDLYKDWKEANSPTIRENVRDWYISVADTRLHNNSQQLIVFTRWHEEDLVGFIEKKEKVVLIESWDDIEAHKDEDVWFKINFEAIKTGEPTEIDPRKPGEPLWPERHSLEKLERSRAKDPVMFDALFQGNPTSKDGLLYGAFKEYETLPDNILIRKNYTDTADTGDDWLYSIDYDISADGYAYIIDIRCSQEPMEVTEPLTAGGLLKNNVNEADIESNNGGRGFARKVNEMTGHRCVINWFHQGDNKEARIISNSATVMERIIMPKNWHLKFPVAYQQITSFKRKFKANMHDDCADVLTGIVERMDFVNSGSLTVDYEDL